MEGAESTRLDQGRSPSYIASGLKRWPTDPYVFGFRSQTPPAQRAAFGTKGEKGKTEGVIDDAGWMHTGDLATIDSEAYCVGRIKDMVIRGGENPYPREIEEFLYRHPKIEEAQVFGVADLKYGEKLCVWIKVEEESEDDVRAFCTGQIAHQKAPRYIMFVDEFPMTVTGKMQKVIMRQRTEEQLGLKAMTTA